MDELFPTVILPLGNVGYQTDLPTVTRSLSHYKAADNVIFDPGGQIRKFGGAEKINNNVIPGAVNIMGMVDYWKGGGATTFTQKFVVVTSNGKVYKEDMDGVFDDITGTATILANPVPVFCIANGLLHIFFSNGSAPLTWNQSGDVAALGGTPPLAKGMVYAHLRGFAWLGSRLYYSASGNTQDWAGADTGSIDFDPGDGDEIIGCCVYKENIVVFKGPNTGSIHVLYGTSPTGSDAFAKKPLVRGIALQSHNSIIPAGDDVVFLSPRGIHLLSAVQQFGNYAEADITRFLKRHFRENVNRTTLNQTWGVNYLEKSCLLWSTTQAGNTENDQMFGLSYGRVQEDGWKPFTVTRDCYSLAIRQNPVSKLHEVVSGGTDGFVRRQDTASKAIDASTAYAFKLQSPKMLLGQGDRSGKSRGDQPITLQRTYVRSESTGRYKLTADMVRDNEPAEHYQFSLGAENGFILDTSVLDVDAIGNPAMEIGYSNPPIIGDCRALEFTLTQGGLNQDANLIEMGIEYTPSAQSDISTVNPE